MRDGSSKCWMEGLIRIFLKKADNMLSMAIYRLGVASAMVFLWVQTGLCYSADTPNYEFGGHIKSRLSAQAFPEGSIFRDLSGGHTQDLNNELRINFDADTANWKLDTDAQIIALYGDSVETTRELENPIPQFDVLFGRLPNDDRRWWDLTHIHEDENNTAVLSRLDRLALSYTGKSTFFRFGRQALSWGNGLFYSPMDIVNPFEPTQVDTEYKAGDDMLYGQYLQENGNDLEGSYVVRRDPLTGEVERNQSTYATRYNGFRGMAEYNLMLAMHYDEWMTGFGVSFDAAGAVWRSDLVLSDTDTDGLISQLVVNSSYSWMWADKNVTGSAEYFFNGFGRSDGCYTTQCLEQSPELLTRVARGQLYNLGRHYLGGSITMEITPLFTLTSNQFWNLSDGSGLFQLVTRNSLGNNLDLLSALGIPMGPVGSEYGGLEALDSGQSFSTDMHVFMQLAWYF
jgi:hypothetical protein